MLPDDMIRKPRRENLPVWLTPLFGALATLSFGSYVALLGGGLAAGQIAMILVLGIAGVRLLYYMDALDGPHPDGRAPNPKLTVALLLLSVLLFWVPVAGLVLIYEQRPRATRVIGQPEPIVRQNHMVAVDHGMVTVGYGRRYPV